MIKEPIPLKKIPCRSPLINSPVYQNSCTFHQNISPNRYCMKSEAIETRPIFSNFSSRSSSSNCYNSLGGKSSENISKKILGGKQQKQVKNFENLPGFKKPPVDKGNANTSYLKVKSKELAKQSRMSLKQKIGEFKNKLNTAMHCKTPSIQGENDENSVPKGKKTPKVNKSLTNSCTSNTDKNTTKLPVAKVRGDFSDKRKLPARYLRIQTPDAVLSKELNLRQNSIKLDLQLIQSTNSQSLLKDLESEKQSRLHQKALKKNSILKNVYEDESWHWSSPDVSPAKLKKVQFLGNI